MRELAMMRMICDTNFILDPLWIAPVPNWPNSKRSSKNAARIPASKSSFFPSGKRCLSSSTAFVGACASALPGIPARCHNCAGAPRSTALKTIRTAAFS